MQRKSGVHILTLVRVKTNICVRAKLVGCLDNLLTCSYSSA